GTVANTTAVNSYVNGIKVNTESISNDQLLCQKADPRVLTANCSSRTEFLDALDLSYSDVCPVNAAKESTAAATRPGSTMNFSSSGSVTMTTPPETGSKVPKMTFSDPDFATFAAPKPLVASPSPAVIACIATLGTVIFLLVGVIAYRYCSQRSSTNAGRNRAEPMPPPPL
ncbi:hypothetical protein, partial [Salinisphaera sp. G21_0]|uniref:hypothetical protein n=1 Tax=Salinisphaera sp. G21_0 TaxID=2821094 RepID=UPI001ADA069F